ncbi:MAG: CDF family Co(II)/Ni(II) efflux transporter DmeF [Chloroflexota bacterium]
MHIYTLNKWQHDHTYTGVDPSNERKTLLVVLLTAGMMCLEIAAGVFFGSMALLADGWHMSTHAVALGITLFAYRYARRHANNPRYTFGTGKIGILGGYTSAVVLLVIAVMMALESVERFFVPQDIRFGEAIAVAVVGLVVNLLSVRLLGHENHHHGHHEGHEHAHHEQDADHHGHADEDHNLKAAYLHVLADTMTSVLAIVALLAGSFFGWLWLDAAMGIVGGLVIGRWAFGLLQETGHILLDGQANPGLVAQVRSLIEADADTRLADLHVWQVSERSAAAIISLVTHYPRPVAHYRSLLAGVPALAHVTIEVNVCDDEACMPESRPQSPA